MKNPVDFVICRICLDQDTPNSMITPCVCSGSSRYVHALCLSQWRAMKLTSRFRCEVCKNYYQFDIHWLNHVVIQSCCWIGVLVYAYFCLNICHFIIAWLGLVPHTSRIESLQYTSHYYSTIQFFYRLLHHIGPSALLIDYFIAINKKKKVSRIITSLKIFFCWVISFYSSHINQVIAFFSDCLYISLTIFGIIRVLWISRVTAKSLSPTVTIILADLNRHEK